jgi:Polyketide cyclase / dehydrase and lipid transport
VAGSLYKFRSTWQVSAAPDDVYAVLERLPDYPLWWPQVRSVTPLGNDTYELVCRSSLPYELRFTTKQSVRDPIDRVLEASMSGDLDGFSRWTIANDARGTRATFDEQVVATKALLRRLELIARPAFKANHARMMRDGERGLRTYLAGYHARLDRRSGHD